MLHLNFLLKDLGRILKMHISLQGNIFINFIKELTLNIILKMFLVIIVYILTNLTFILLKA